MKRGIDHLVLCVRDLKAAAAFYTRLGFTTTPRAEHPWGTDNVLVQFQGCFLELLTLARPSLVPTPGDGEFGFGAFNRDYLARREGMSMLVFESADARADREEFIARGFPAYENFYFERQARLPGGETVTVAFTLAFAVDPRMSEAAFFCCQQHAPEYFWKPEYQRHPNGAFTVREVVMAAGDPGAVAAFFEKIQEPGCVEPGPGGFVVTTPRGRISVLDPDAVASRYGRDDLAGMAGAGSFLGFTAGVDDLGAVSSILVARGVPFERAGARIRVWPEHAHGMLVEFEA